MGKIDSLNHTKWDCKYHVVFIPPAATQSAPLMATQIAPPDQW